jgi:hypothetical protein
MSTAELLDNIKKLSEHELQGVLTQLLQDSEVSQEIEKLGYLRLTEKALEFWNDRREDTYQNKSCRQANNEQSSGVTPDGYL